MAKSLAIGVVIGAALGSTFGRTLGSAKEQFNTLGHEIKALSDQRGVIERFEKDEAALEKARLKLAATQKEVVSLKLALRKNPADEGTAKALAKTQAKADKLSAALEKQKITLSESKTALEKAGFTVGKLRDQYARLGEAIDKAAAKSERMQARMDRKDAAASRLGSLRGAAVGAIGTIYGAGRLVSQAMDFEHEMRMFGNVAGLSNDRLAQIRGQINQLSAVTNQAPGELLVALNDLTAKGLDPDRAVASLGIIGKTATASGASIGDLASTAFTLIDAMGLSPDDLPAAMDMLSKAGKEGSFELRDMAQYFPMLTAQAKSLGLVGKEGIATLGSALQIAMKGASDPSRAANNFQNFLAKLTAPETVARFEKMGVDIEEAMKEAMAAGQNPVEEMVRLVEELTGGDKFRIGELFGDMQVINFLNPMLQNMEEFNRIKQDVLSADGVVDEDFKAMLTTGKEALKGFTLAVIRLGETFGKTLLPAVGAVLGQLAPMVGWAANMIDKYPAIGTLLGYFAIGLGSVAAGMGIAVAATWLWNAALLANPMTWVVGAVVAGVAAIITFWEPITNFFKRLWGGIKEIFSDGVKFLTKVWEYSPLGLVFKAGEKLAGFVGGLFGGRETNGMATAGAPAEFLPDVPVAGSTSASSMVNAPITINAAPGMDERAVAGEVARALDERERQAQARRRGALHD